jgi:hypothetical protein
MGYYVMYFLLPLLPTLLVLCVLVRGLAPRRRRLQRTLIGASVGCWVGLGLPVYYDLAELVRYTKCHSPHAYTVVQGLGFSGSHYDMMWFWNALVITFWLMLLLSSLAYWSASPTGKRPLVGIVAVLLLLAGRVSYYAYQPPKRLT